MVEVIVSFRDAVFAALMTWGGVGDDVDMAAGTRNQPDAPHATPAAIEKASEPVSRRLC